MSSTNDLLTVKCSPADYQIKLTTTALLLIDMQRDFLERGGFGAVSYTHLTLPTT